MPTTLRFHLDGDNAWPDLKDRLDEVMRLEPDAVQFAALRGGMVSGKPSVTVRIDLPDGNVAFWETSMANFMTMALAFEGRYGRPTE